DAVRIEGLRGTGQRGFQAVTQAREFLEVVFMRERAAQAGLEVALLVLRDLQVTPGRLPLRLVAADQAFDGIEHGLWAGVPRQGAEPGRLILYAYLRGVAG